MTKREKIILFIMCLTLIYGYYVFFVETPQSRKPLSSGSSSSLESYNKFISMVSDQTREGLSDVDLYIIDQISQTWTKDPLLTTTDALVEPGVATSDTARPSNVDIPEDYAYTGFLQMGINHMAIINGVEYERGDELISGDYLVGSISPRQVTLIDKMGGRSITVPLEESP